MVEKKNYFVSLAGDKKMHLDIRLSDRTMVNVTLEGKMNLEK